MRLIAKTVLIIGTGTIAAAAAPLLLLAFIARGAARAYRWAELHAVYDGDKAERDRLEYYTSL